MAKVTKILKYYSKEDGLFHVEKYDCFDHLVKNNTYTNFLSFCRAVRYDLRGAVLLGFNFDGIDLKKYRISDAIIDCEILKKHGLYDNVFYSKSIEPFISTDICSFEENLLMTVDSNRVPSKIYIDYFYRNGQNQVYYISDLHLNHKIIKKYLNGASINEIKYYCKQIATKFRICGYNYYDYLLISGDTSFDFEISKMFYSELAKAVNPRNTVVILGNHELWDSKYSGLPCVDVNDMIAKYREMLEELGFCFLHNDLLVVKHGENHTIKEKDLLKIGRNELRDFCCESTFTVLGGIGFSAYNERYNAEAGIYRDTIKTHNDDLVHTTKFENLYNKVADILYDYQVICLTHMPKEDWSKSKYQSNWIYVNGHNHKNHYVFSNEKTIFADNQIGYYNDNIQLKYFNTSRNYDIFKKYEDGIYEITKEDYWKFYIGQNIFMRFNRQNCSVYMIKRNGIYCFFLKNHLNNQLYLLNGGSIKKIYNQDLNYYYENLQVYADSLTAFMSNYNDALKDISEQIKIIGGYGTIHGCIVDIDFYNHIYLNPYDHKVTPYFAYDISERTIYNNVPSLLTKNCPELLKNLKERIKNNNTQVVAKDYLSTIRIGLRKIDVKGKQDRSEIYKISRFIKNLQYTTNQKIVRNWSDDFLRIAKENNNERLVQALLDFIS